MRRGGRAAALCRRLLSGLLLCAGCLALAAEPTVIDVHVLSRDGKFVGSNVGGARVTLRNAESGEVLAQGITEGETGDTELIMKEAGRWDDLVTEGAARFRASLALEAPTRITVEAYGPLDHPQSANTVTATQQVLPGPPARRWIVELPGLIVEPLALPALVTLDGEHARIPLEAEVRLMCGCPLTPGGVWDSDEFEISARVLLNGTEIAATTLEHAGEPSRFRGTLDIARPGQYRLQITAHQPRTGNAGAYEQALVVH